jgi:predicted RNA-binding protein
MFFWVEERHKNTSLNAHRRHRIVENTAQKVARNFEKTATAAEAFPVYSNVKNSS